jgi:hypothetical protein
MKEIDQIWALLAEDSPEQEGIMGALMPNGMWMALVSGNEAHAQRLKEIAREMGLSAGKKVRLVKFSNRTVIEEL